MDEAELIARSQKGDQDSFQLLMERYRADLSRTAYLTSRDSETARDIVQETLVQLWKSLPAYRPTGSFRAWMLKVLLNQSNRQYRRKRVQTVPLDEAMGLESGAESPHTVAQREEEHQMLREALAGLSNDHREVLILRYFSELTVPEIAQTLSCRQGTVKSRLSRAQEQLRDALTAGAMKPIDLREAQS